MKAQLPVEPGTVGGHQIHPLHLAQPGAVQKRFYHLAAEAPALQVAGHHDVPEDGSVDAVAAGPPEAHQPFAAPEAHHNGAAAKHLA